MVVDDGAQGLSAQGSTAQWAMLARLVLRAPFTAVTWRATAHLAAGCLLGVASSGVMFFAAGLTLGCAPTGLLGLPALALLLSCSRGFSRAQRSRFAGCLGVRLPELPPWPMGRSRLSRLFAEARSPLAWRAVGYHLFVGVTGTVAFLALIACWTAGTTLTTVALYKWTLPQVNIFGWHMHDPAVLFAIGAVGVLAFFVAPWVARGLASADVWLATSLLGPSRVVQLDDRVRTLTVSRAGLVDATDLERRHLERDLHDGIQQRLTSLAVHLGMAREELGDAPEPVRQVIVEAHEQSKQTLSDLRDIVRGLHPAVLESRGLDAALSGVVARVQVDVDLRVDVPVRPAPAIEAVAYFVVCEALTNVTKHAGARRVEVDVRRVGDVLRLLFVDDGEGGASLDGGTGLRGMSQRVASVDGRIDLVSPPGEGTRITVELPCQT